MSKKKIKVLYVSGWGRSGSTIFGRVLGEIDGFFFPGELRYTWFHWADDRRCGCGLQFRKCSMWESVLRKSLGDGHRLAEVEMLRLHNLGNFLPALPLSVVPGLGAILKKRIRTYASELESLYRAIQEKTECRLIIDTTKYPNYGYILGQIPSIELYVVHLVRHPCATAYSWRKEKLLDPVKGSYFPQRTSAKCAITWSIQNIAAEIFGRQNPDNFLRLRYDDFVRNPESSIISILKLIGLDASLPPVLHGNRIQLSPVHTVSGNPNRFQSGPIQLRLDEEWKRKMSATDMKLVRLITWPLARRYGYTKDRRSV